MNQSAGLGNLGVPYEFVVRPKRTKRLIAERVCLIVLYVMWVALNVAATILLGDYIALMVGFCAFTLWVFYFFTWHRTFVEYEYIIYDGRISLYRILGGRSRRKLTAVEIKSIDAIIPYDDEHLSRIVAFDAKKKLYAISSMDAPTLYVLLWKDERDIKRLLCAELTDKAIKMLRYYNNSAFRA